MPIGNAQNKHIVTIEGINATGLTPVQNFFANEGATQCGFCTPGFIVSLTGYCLNEKVSAYDDALEAINGNICRCTGYKSIERAVFNLNAYLQEDGRQVSLQSAVEMNIVPAYFAGIGSRLRKLQTEPLIIQKKEARIVGGGTDLYVQQHEAMVEADIQFISTKNNFNKIIINGNRCDMGAAATVADMAASPVFQEYFPDLSHYVKLVSSTQIRNMATLAGNFCNASPIGDLTIFFLALDAQLSLNNNGAIRKVDLRNYYKSYKVIDLSPGEFVETISFVLPAQGSVFNFEKVSKRTHLDIASVNSAIYLQMEANEIVAAGISAGGVGPVPLYLSKSSEFLTGKLITADLIRELINIAQGEISPISDARGSADYKRLLLGQLIKAHFIRLFPSTALESLISVPS